MPDNVETKLVAEIKLLQEKAETERRAIKRNLSSGKPVEEEERHHRELRTRLGLLEGNLKKLREPRLR